MLESEHWNRISNLLYWGHSSSEIKRSALTYVSRVRVVAWTLVISWVSSSGPRTHLQPPLPARDILEKCTFSRLPWLFQLVNHGHSVAKDPQKAIYFCFQTDLPADWTCYVSVPGLDHEVKWLSLLSHAATSLIFACGICPLCRYISSCLYMSSVSLICTDIS